MRVLPTLGAAAAAALLVSGCRISVCRGPTGSPAYFCGAAGQKINPAGMNYTQVTRLSFTYPGFNKNDFVHSTLYTGLYDPVRVDAALSQMSAGGYLFIRVFIAYDGAGYVW